MLFSFVIRSFGNLLLYYRMRLPAYDIFEFHIHMYPVEIIDYAQNLSAFFLCILASHYVRNIQMLK